VLDEPTSSLSERDRERLFFLIRKLRNNGHAIVYISHFLEEVKEVSDRFTVLRDGRTVAEGDARTTSPRQISTMMVGREIGTLYPRSRRSPGETILKVDDLGSTAGLQSASFELRRGEVLGIAGLVGSGRTELLRTIFGLAPVRKGKIRIGVYSGPASPDRRWLQNVGIVSEDRKGEGLATALSIADNMTLTRLGGLGPGGFVLPARQENASRRWIRHLGIRCQHPRQRLTELSGGNQQKVALARLLHHDADALLLDEPTRGIDVASKADIFRLIDQLATGDPASGRVPKAVLMVSSYLPELLGACDRIAVMYRGVLHPAEPVADLDEPRIMHEATGSWEAE
jgi:ribose transport system ATP-binding protein